jgi:phage-related protein
MDCEQLQGFDGTAAQRASPFRLCAVAGVLEVVEDAVGGTYRAVYTVKFAEAVFVLHCFQKKSKSGIATPKADMDIIRARLKVAEALAQELRNAKTNH